MPGSVRTAVSINALGADYIDESEVLTPADDRYHIDKRDFTVPFVCGCRNLGEALRRIAEARGGPRRKSGIVGVIMGRGVIMARRLLRSAKGIRR